MKQHNQIKYVVILAEPATGLGRNRLEGGKVG